MFLKPASSVCYSGQEIVIPAVSSRVDHEVELVVAIGATSAGKRVAPENAMLLVAGYAVGIDVTARDLQDKAKQKSLPWTIAKGFDTFAVLSSFVPASKVADPAKCGLKLEVNGQQKQSGSCSDMLFSIPQLISYLSGIFTLLPGDLIYTGTPSGVGPLTAGDRVKAELTDDSENQLVTLSVGVRSAL